MLLAAKSGNIGLLLLCLSIVTVCRFKASHNAIPSVGEHDELYLNHHQFAVGSTDMNIKINSSRYNNVSFAGGSTGADASSDGAQRMPEKERPVEERLRKENEPDEAAVLPDNLMSQKLCTAWNYSIRVSDFTRRYHKEPCPARVPSLLSAIKHGSRRWDERWNATSMSWEEKEKHPSTFVPAECDMPFLRPPEFCQIANRFSHIVVLGDSLHRHVHYGMMMSFRGNLYNGSHVIKNYSQQDGRGRCTCDMQFNKSCVEFGGSEWGMTLRPTDFCDGANDFVVTFQPQTPYAGNSLYDYDSIDCTQSGFKGLLVIANGGLHLRSRAERTFNKFIVEWLNHPTFRTCVEQKKAYFIWNSYNAHSPLNAVQYPFQSRERGLIFNQKMDNIFKAKKLDIIQVDWFNFTMGAQTLDGLHFVSSVNFFKAQYLMIIADAMKRRDTYLHLPAHNVTFTDRIDTCEDMLVSKAAAAAAREAAGNNQSILASELARERKGMRRYLKCIEVLKQQKNASAQ